MKIVKKFGNIAGAIFALAFIFGCDSDTSIAGCAESNDAIPVDLRVGTKPIGSGIVLDDENNKGACILVTARHVVTINRNYLKNISLTFPDDSQIHLGDSTRRWLTEDDENFDIALLKLHKSELPKRWRDENRKKIKVGLRSTPYFTNGAALRLVNPRVDNEAEYICRQVVSELFFPSNLYLKSASLDVGIMKMQIPKSMSGSPVICSKTSALVGSAVISHDKERVTGFIDFKRILPLVMKVQSGGSVSFLADLKNLW